TTTKSPDSRYGMMSPVSNTTVKLPSGLTMTSNSTRTVTLSNPADPLSVTSSTDTLTVNAKATRTTFNKATMTFTTTTPMGKQITSKIDQQGRVTQSQVAGILPIQYSYDVHGRVSSVTQGTRVRSYSYDALGNMATVTDPMGRATSYAYDAAHNATSETLPDGRAIGYSYDPNRNVTSIAPPSRPAHGFIYTPVDLQSSYAPPVVTGSGLNATSFNYNLDKQVRSVTRPDGKVETYSYDTAGRMAQVSSPDGNVVYAYGTGGSCCGNPDLLKSSTFTPTGGSPQIMDYVYDGALLTSTTWSGVINGSVARTYDNFFRITSRSVNGGAAITQTYDNDGYLSSSGAMTITRDIGNGNIIGTTLGSVTTARTYSGYGESATTTAKYAASTLASVQYTRDSLGRITRKAETIQGVTDAYDYTYDTTGRLTGVAKNGVSLSSYTFDANNNRLTHSSSAGVVSATYDAQDRLLTYGANSYSYTADGELTTKTASGQATAYTYDTFGNLTAVSFPDGMRIDYLLDSQGRRVGKKVNGTLTQGWLYKDGLKPIAELDGTGALVSLFAYGTMANVPDYMVKNGITYRIVSDHLGSPRLLVNIADGSVAQRMDYDEYGNILTDTNPGFQPFGFAGGLYDVNTKLTRFGARDYDAETGRWTSKDPIGFDGGDTNLYGYVLNDPVNWIDMNGEYATVIPTVVGICLLNPEICAAIPPLVFCALFPEACGLPSYDCPQSPPMLSDGGDSSDGNERDTQRETKTPKEGARGKEGATDVPSWAKGRPPYKGESGREYADRLMDGKYGKGNYGKGRGGEHGKIKKYGDRHWE
ncbi:MAG: RHS repeat-associated core domain-containing protein, partial [Nitrospinae bacterium]|nr:RHS repeat-associated core domain-containing protein [Nitrospinota bacterium]